ncbi:MAG: hypothetical protein IM631_12370 [Cytophagales bacterium]|nr:hypothetical protein [Cytophagales bacterium]MCA6372165.1 hypothetical protein [Cytophagales bacterium]MCA6375521.1 hypothetical protein [Cytophagales bacterium]MCA6382309.1 hypothetical protein [Cytophagales bacterium]
MAILTNRYPIESETDILFSFTSVGPKGNFKMQGRFALVDQENMIYNCGFGLYCINPEGEPEIDDSISLHNGDMDVIFNTIAYQVSHFLELHPTSVVMIFGSTPSRTRKYSQLISRHFMAIDSKYTVFAELPDRSTKLFEPNKPGYSAFFFRRK